jgi:hypothetical protein
MSAPTAGKRRKGNAERRCRKAYPFEACSICGSPHVLDAAHLDGDSANDDPANLAWLCKSHHWLVDHNGMPREAVIILRDWWQRTQGEPPPERRKELSNRAKRARATSTKRRLEPGRQAEQTMFDPLGQHLQPRKR